MKLMKSLLGSTARQIMVLVCLLFCGQIAFADENFVSGTYQDTTGNQYLVSGGAPSQTGRTQWTIISTTPKVAGTTNTFNAIWETGAAVGNTWLPGNNNVLNYPDGYASGRSYGVVSDSNWSYFSEGDVISVSQVGTTLVVNRLNANGSTYSSKTLNYVSAGSATTASTTTYQSGVYQDSTGNQYLVTGAAPSQTGRAQWTIISTTPKVAGTTNTFNAIWETGAAVGNTWLPGNNNVLNYPDGYASGRSYGVVSDSNWSYFSEGDVISASQVGTTLIVNRLNANGSVYSSITLSYVSAGGATTASTITYQSGTYQDSTGNQYLVTGAAPSTTGREQWTIISTTPKVAGKTNTFNAIWETGAAVGNTWLPGNNNVLNYPDGYASGRSYGVVSDSNWSYFSEGDVISVSQVGTTLIVNRLNANGSVYSSITLSYVSAGGATTASTTTYQSGTYQDSSGNQYLVTGTDPCTTNRAQWTIKATTPKLAGTTNTFNAMWETGAAVGNAYLVANSNVTTYPEGYASGRSYGVVSGSSSWSYFSNGNVISVSQVGATLIVNRLNSNGSMYSSKTLSYIPIAAPSQTISFCMAPAVIVIGGTSTIGGTATSGLAVSYTSSTPSVCSVSGTTVTGIAAGTCTIAADQAGNTTYSAAPQVTKSIPVNVTDARLFTFVERNFASIFPGTPTAGQYLQYNYRHYPSSGNILAVDTSGVIYVFGPVTGNVLTSVGSVSSLTSTITAWEASVGLAY